MEKFVFFGGKGGVGKTTVSSAYAAKCAAAGLETLVVSTDPAHSTSDVFGQQFDDDPQRVDGFDDLWAMEIDPDEEVERHLQEIRRRMNDQVSAAIVNELDRQIELAHQTPGAYEAALFDRFIQVMKSASPTDGRGREKASGVPSSEVVRKARRAFRDDERAKLSRITRRGSEDEQGESSGDTASQNAEKYDRVVFDTSPTGGTLRLLALPEFLDDWIERLIAKRVQSVDLFEKAAIGKQEARRRLDDDPIIAHLRQRKEKFEFAARTLREESAFYLVLNPDDLSFNETERSVAQLADTGLTVDGLVVNKVTPEPDDDEQGRGARFLRERVATERDHLARIREEFDEPVVGVIETRVGDVDVDLLAAVADELDVDVTESVTA